MPTRFLAALVLAFLLLLPPAAADLLVSSSGTDQVLRYDGTAGAFLDVFASGGGLNRPRFLVFTPRAAIPEPASLTLLGLGALGLAGYSWRQRRQEGRRRER
jgi:PEP-CTERM motif